MTIKRNVTYRRPVKGNLYVKLDDGEEWPADEGDLKEFGLVDRAEAYHEFEKALWAAVSQTGSFRDLSDTDLNPIRYLVERVVAFGFDVPDDTLAEVAELQRAAAYWQANKEPR